ncbi:MAG: SMC-Scp complex subunit ScpB [Planctomycetes bacterium]|nr:SMC-Scp complex subunit ScpB [Planctomycetota bacterium]
MSEEPLSLDDFRQAPQEQGLSLDQLSSAFAKMLGGGHDPYSPTGEILPSEQAPDRPSERASDLHPRPSAVGDADPGGEVSPRSILEAMLFVGTPDNSPLTSQGVASLMRGVRPAEIDELVRELNEQYAGNRCPYRIDSAADGYRLVLREEFAGLRDRLHGRVRQARLSQAAIDVLALVAYHEPLTSDEVSKKRGRSSGPILTQLVRRQLLRIERPADAPRTPRYFTTQRFLDLFGLESLSALPRSQDFDLR